MEYSVVLNKNRNVYRIFRDEGDGFSLVGEVRHIGEPNEIIDVTDFVRNVRAVVELSLRDDIDADELFKLLEQKE